MIFRVIFEGIKNRSIADVKDHFIGLEFVDRVRSELSDETTNPYGIIINPLPIEMITTPSVNMKWYKKEIIISEEDARDIEKFQDIFENEGLLMVRVPHDSLNSYIDLNYRLSFNVNNIEKVDWIIPFFEINWTDVLKAWKKDRYPLNWNPPKRTKDEPVPPPTIVYHSDLLGRDKPNQHPASSISFGSQTLEYILNDILKAIGVLGDVEFRPSLEEGE